MTAPRVDEDEPESDDQEPPMWNTPLDAKQPLKLGDFDESENTGMTSPCSSSKTHSSLQSRDFTIQFCDDHDILEIDCDYTDEQVSKLWFTKEEYDFFLEECDEDAQKHEEWEKETRVNKLKKEIKRQRRQRQKEDKRTPRIRSAEALDESMNSQANFEPGEDGGEDDSDDDESVPEYNEDEDGWMCPLGLEAWTLDGYKAREQHRQKAIDSVLNEQYAAWDRGMVENMEMMSALYFAASAISKHEAHKKAKELEEDIQQQVVVSTLEDYNKAVQTLNVLQKSLACIKSKQKAREASKVEARPLARRRGSTGGIGTGSVAPRRGSTGSIGSESAISSMASPEIDRMLALSEHSLDLAPQLPAKSSYPTQNASASSARKKPKQRKSNDSATQKIYKSKAQTEIIFMPPTPPVTKKPAVVYKPSKGGPSKGGPPKEFDLMVAPLTKSSKLPTKSSKHRKIVYKPVVDGPPKVEGSRVSRSSETETTKKKKKKTKGTTTKPKKNSSKSERPRSKSPHQSELNSSKARRRSKSPCPSDLYANPRPRSKSPHSSEIRDSSSKHSRSNDFDRERRRSKSPHSSEIRDSSSKHSRSSDFDRERRRSKSPHSSEIRDSSSKPSRRSKSPHARVAGERLLSKSPRAKSISPKDSEESSVAGKFLKKMGSRSKGPTKASAKGYAPLSNHTSNSPHQSRKKEHWWYQQQRQACQ